MKISVHLLRSPWIIGYSRESSFHLRYFFGTPISFWWSKRILDITDGIGIDLKKSYISWLDDRNLTGIFWSKFCSCWTSSCSTSNHHQFVTRINCTITNLNWLQTALEYNTKRAIYTEQNKVIKFEKSSLKNQVWKKITVIPKKAIWHLAIWQNWYFGLFHHSKIEK